ncbi:MAG: hypothetical protein FWC15_08245 [Fibromonadales bacterium]|nr:hypothetical protein [Fibromonadales bacterium]
MSLSSVVSIIAQRQSDRSYKTTPVEPEKIQLCIEAGRLAKSSNCFISQSLAEYR